MEPNSPILIPASPFITRDDQFCLLKALPFELLDKVFDWLDVISLINTSMVCKPLHEFINLNDKSKNKKFSYFRGIRQALKTGNALPNGFKKAKVLTVIAKQLFKLRNPISQNIFEQLFGISRKIAKNQRDNWRAFFANQIYPIFPRKAEEFIKRINDQDVREFTSSRNLKLLIRTNPMKVLGTFKKLQNPDLQDDVMFLLGNSFLPESPDQADDIFAKIQNPFLMAQGFLLLGIHYENKNRQIANSYFHFSLETVNQIESPICRIQALVKIGQAIENFDSRVSQEISQSIIQIMTQHHFQGDLFVLKSVMPLLSKHQSEWVKSLIDIHLNRAIEMQDTLQKTLNFIRISQLLEGLNPTASKELFGKAMELIQSQAPEIQIQYCVCLIQDLNRFDFYSPSGLLKQIQEGLDHISDPILKDQAKFLLVKDLASTKPDKAFEMANQIDNDNLKAKALTSVVEIISPA